MIKNRFPSPYEFIWREDTPGTFNKDNLFIHICNYLTCEDGCSCELQHINPDFLKEFVEKYL